MAERKKLEDGRGEQHEEQHQHSIQELRCEEGGGEGGGEQMEQENSGTPGTTKQNNNTKERKHDDRPI